jgi:hypothetical protein
MGKMIRLLAIAATVLIFPQICLPEEWAKSYSVSAGGQSCSVRQTPDGGYIAAGDTGTGFWVLRLDQQGEIIWQKDYRDLAVCGLYYVVTETLDHEGYLDGYVIGGGDMGVLRLNPSGDIVWQKTYGSCGDYAKSIQQVFDQGGYPDGYVVAGSNADVRILRLNADGTVAWDKTYEDVADGFDSAQALSIEQTADGGYAVTGWVFSELLGYRLWVLRLDAGGEIEWQNNYRWEDESLGRSIRQTSDGGYIVAGQTYLAEYNRRVLWVLKLHANGDVAWQKTYGASGQEFGFSIHQAADGGYVVAGETSSFGAGSYDLWVLKLNGIGDIEWQRTYGGDEWELQPCIHQTSDGGYVMAGFTRSWPVPPRDDLYLFVLKLNAQGQIPRCSLVGTSDAMVITPPAEVDHSPFLTQSWPTIPGDTHFVSESISKKPYRVCPEPVIAKLKPSTCEPGEAIRIIGRGFGDHQRDSAIRIGNKTFDSTSSKIGLWTDTKIKIKIPKKKYTCQWFRDKDYRGQKLWVTVDGGDSNKEKLKIRRVNDPTSIDTVQILDHLHNPIEGSPPEIGLWPLFYISMDFTIPECFSLPATVRGIFKICHEETIIVGQEYVTITVCGENLLEQYEVTESGSYNFTTDALRLWDYGITEPGEHHIDSVLEVTYKGEVIDTKMNSLPIRAVE